MKNYDFVAKEIFEGRRIVRKDGLIGFVDESGNEVIAPQYVRASNFENGCSIVEKRVYEKYTSKEEMIIDKQGNVIFKTKKCSISRINESFFKISTTDFDIDYIGIVNSKGKVIVPVEDGYSSYTYYSECKIFVVEKLGQYIIINQYGQKLKQLDGWGYSDVKVIDEHNAEVALHGNKQKITF